MTSLSIVPEGWQSTDEAEMPASRDVSSSQHIDTISPIHALGTHQEQKTHDRASHPHLASVVGIVAVLLGAGFFFGVINLRGSLTDPTTEKTVTVTEDGRFEPSTINVVAGTVIRFINENSVPQVIKPIDAQRSLFPSIAIIDSPMTAIIPAEASAGEYVYSSAMLDDKATLTIVVSKSTTETRESQTQTVIPIPPQTSVETLRDIPLPFAEDTPMAPVTLSATHNETTSKESETAVITLGAKTQTTDLPALGTKQLPVNTRAGRAETSAPRESLHSGAPLDQRIMRSAPPRMSETGTHSWIIVLSMLIASIVVLRRARA